MALAVWQFRSSRRAIAAQCNESSEVRNHWNELTCNAKKKKRKQKKPNGLQHWLALYIIHCNSSRAEYGSCGSIKPGINVQSQRLHLTWKLRLQSPTTSQQLQAKGRSANKSWWQSRSVVTAETYAGRHSSDNAVQEWVWQGSVIFFFFSFCHRSNKVLRLFSPKATTTTSG